MIFPFDHSTEMITTEATFMTTSLVVRDCLDIGKQPLDNEAECRLAASELSGLHYDWSGTYSHNPKGCVRRNAGVIWNKHGTGSARDGYFVICKNSGT